MLPSPYHAFAAKAASRPDLPFLIAPACAGLPYAPDGFRITYGQAAAQIAALQAAFGAAGYGHGARVALVLQNRPAFLVHWLALNAIGASIVPINADMRPDEVRYQLDTAGVDLVVTLPDFADLVAQGCPKGVPVMQPGDAVPVPARPRAPRDGQGTDEAALLFTSGSTGKPKACILSNLYFMHLADWYVNQDDIARVAEDCEVALTPLPLFHMNALGCTCVGMMVRGGAIVPLDRFQPGRWWQTVAESGATIVHSLGVIPAILLQLPPGPFDRAHRARFTLGPGVDARHKIDFEARFNLPIIEGWAMTETGGSGVTSTAGISYPPGLRCIGVPRAGVEVRIVDDAGADVAADVPGELLVRAAGDDPRFGFFSGYLGDPAATEEAWQGGWFHTGDIVSRDRAGLLYFVDRKKSIVRRSGENISALEVEAALVADPAVTAAAVTPVPDALRGEEVFAFIVTDGATDDAAALALVSRVAQRLSYHKLPGHIAFTSELPVSSTQKLQRGTLKTLAQAALDSGAAIDLTARKAGFRNISGKDKP